MNSQLRDLKICKFETIANLQTKIKRIWSNEYKFFVSIGKHYKPFFDYLRRIKIVYPSFDARLLYELQSFRASPLDIDREFIKLIVQGGRFNNPLTSEDLIQILMPTSKVSGIDVKTPKYVRIFLQELFGMNMFEINQQFYWRPRIIELLKNGYARLEDILRHNYFKDHYKSIDTLRRLFNKVFSKELDKIMRDNPHIERPFSILLRQLINKYRKKI